MSKAKRVRQRNNRAAYMLGPAGLVVYLCEKGVNPERLYRSILRFDPRRVEDAE